MGKVYISSILQGNSNDALIRAAMESAEVGVEYFVFKLTDEETDTVERMHTRLGRPLCTFHSPMINAESTSGSDTEENSALFENWIKSLKLCKRLGAKQIVFHTNNCFIDANRRLERQENCMRNALKLNKLCSQFGITMLVETLALPCKGAPIFTDREFVKFVKENHLAALVDVGHMNLNGYNYEYVLSELGSRIKAYHIHNNDGIDDSHEIIGRGTFDYVYFANMYQKYTPDADLVIEYIEIQDLTAAQLIADVITLQDIIQRKNILCRFD